jgi:hypothetical protein
MIEGVVLNKTNLKNVKNPSWVWWFMPVIPAPGRLTSLRPACATFHGLSQNTPYPHRSQKDYKRN